MIPFQVGVSDGDKIIRSNDGITYKTSEGTTSASGSAVLTLGNNVASGTAGNKYGRVMMYGNSSGSTTLIPGNNSTNNINLTLPSSTGNLLSDNAPTIQNPTLHFPLNTEDTSL